MWSKHTISKVLTKNSNISKRWPTFQSTNKNLVFLTSIQQKMSQISFMFLLVKLNSQQVWDKTHRWWANCSTQNDSARWHQLRLLGTHCVLLPDGSGRLPSDRRHSLQDTARLLLPHQLMRQPLPLCYHDCTVQEGLDTAFGQVSVMSSMVFSKTDSLQCLWAKWESC